MLCCVKTKKPSTCGTLKTGDLYNWPFSCLYYYTTLVIFLHFCFTTKLIQCYDGKYSCTEEANFLACTPILSNVWVV